MQWAGNTKLAGKSRNKGVIRLLHDEVKAQLVPALEEIGFIRDPTLALEQGWDYQGYNWHFIQRIDDTWLVRLWINTSTSRDPELVFRWRGYLLDTEGQTIDEAAHNLAKAIEHLSGRKLRFNDYEYNPIPRMPLSPYAWLGELAFGFPSIFSFIPKNIVIQLIAVCILYPLIMLVMILGIPINIVGWILSERWLKSDKARSGIRQKKIAALAARRVKSLPGKLKKLRETAIALEPLA